MLNKKIHDLIPTIKHYFQDKPVLRAWLFGSCSRGEETPTSDIDILVDYDESKGVVSLLKFARPSVERDKILIYERKS